MGRERAWVFHAGALGDCVLVWPLLRAMLRQNNNVTFVAHDSHARLTAWAFGLDKYAGERGTLQTLSAERPEFSRLWRSPEHDERVIDPAATRVLTFVADEDSASGREWHTHARRVFPAADTAFVGPPGSAARRYAWHTWQVERLGGVERTPDGHGAVLFVGAGGASKRWDLTQWRTLAQNMQKHVDVRLIAGLVEREQWGSRERALFADASGTFCEDLLGLGEMIQSAGLYIGCDSGPTHLAAQLGVPTLALFGPTDPAIWRPVGPAVRVLAPSQPGLMSWLQTDVVEAAARELV